MLTLNFRQFLCPLTALILLTASALSVSAQMTVHTVVPGTSDPWLAGMPGGSTASIGDVAPDQSPVLVSGFILTGGDRLTFAATGSVSYQGGTPSDPPDGNFSYDTGHINNLSTADENGISDVTMPVDAMLGVFLGPDQPNLSAAPGALDFTLQASQDYLSLSPELKQVFFIGDGMTSTSILQQVIAPIGATRLYLGNMDGFDWIGNTGAFNADVTNLDAAPVPESSANVSLGLLLVLGAGSVLARRKGAAR